jgi:hypothetical protein
MGRERERERERVNFIYEAYLYFVIRENVDDVYIMKEKTVCNERAD